MYSYVCKECGKKFSDKNKNRVYCSKQCKTIALTRRLSQKKKDLTGQKFGRLIAIKSKNVNKRYKWYCECDCGNKIWVSTANLINGHTKSCGCLSRETASKNSNKYFSNYRKNNYIEGTSIVRLKSKRSKNNCSGVRGVYFDNTSQKWIAKLTFRGKTYKKSFRTKSEAINYRKYLEEKYFKPILEAYVDKR